METTLRFTSTMRQSLRALDLVNLLQADVGAGLGPFLAIYLMASRGWKPEMIGLALNTACFRWECPPTAHLLRQMGAKRSPSHFLFFRLAERRSRRPNRRRSPSIFVRSYGVS